SFSYGKNPLLERVSFSIQRGDYVGIIGPNGGGKTTLLKILVGLLRPDSGSVRIKGEPHDQKTRRLIGYVPQHGSQSQVDFPATVREIVSSGRIPRGFWGGQKKSDREAIDRTLQIAGMTQYEHSLIQHLSGGERQRVHVARALAGEPEILILDEPFTGIDVAAQRDFYAFLKKLNQEHDMTILFVSHDIDVISDEVKSVLCLNRGLFCFGAPYVLHEPQVIEHLYGKTITHIHHSH
ncbi:MAG TPA: metal ABC transporter ATP-binding protein, partial [Patescibacteria group bacterium]|nr:metal ABC transporter ATP-binding protein [Patescibacteria group bacterium]